MMSCSSTPSEHRAAGQSRTRQSRDRKGASSVKQSRAGQSRDRKGASSAKQSRDRKGAVPPHSLPHSRGSDQTPVQPLRIPPRNTALLFTGVILIWTSLAPGQTTKPAPPDAPSLQLRAAQQEVFRHAAREVADCVVTIETIGGTQPVPDQPGGPRFKVAEGPTTGVIYSHDGLILTSAFNFARDPSVITVRLPDGRRSTAKLVARDDIRKLAMIKVDAENLPTPRWIESSDDVSVGQWAIALGQGYGPHVDGHESGLPYLSVGVISGLNRFSGLAVQTDANLSPANFGGSLIDIDGRVIGICVPMGMSDDELAGVEWYDSGIGFAIPAWEIQRTAADLARGETIRRGLLGVRLDLATTDAVRVAMLADPSPAKAAGIKPGDIITTIDGHPVRHALDMKRLLRPFHAGQRIRVAVKRGGPSINDDNTPIDLDEARAAPGESPTAPEQAPIDRSTTIELDITLAAEDDIGAFPAPPLVPQPPPETQPADGETRTRPPQLLTEQPPHRRTG